MPFFCSNSFLIKWRNIHFGFFFLCPLWTIIPQLFGGVKRWRGFISFITDFLGVEEECDVSRKWVDACIWSEKLIPFVMGVTLCYVLLTLNGTAVNFRVAANTTNSFAKE